MSEKQRCFIALDLPDNMISELKKIQEEVGKQNLFIGKLTEENNLHLTLKFLGSIQQSSVEEIRKKLKHVSVKSFEASIDELGVFSEEFVRIVWAKLNGNEIFELQKQIDNVLASLFSKEERFMSHITIARVKSLKEKQKLIDYIEKFKLNEIKGKIISFSLMKSVLVPSGPIYEVIEKYPLA